MVALAAGLLAGTAPASPARADGAFPDSMQLLVPADHPHRIILATNFGLIISEDDGATWEWTCEPRGMDDKAILYQRAAAPSDRIFSVLVGHGLVYTDDLACSWTPSGGSLATAVASDAFADPTSADRVLAVATEPSDTLIAPSVYRSEDGGLTFGPALTTGPAGGGVLGVENAVSDPQSVYVAMYATTGIAEVTQHPILSRSIDGGAHWSMTDLAGSLGPSVIRIIGIDPTDPLRVFLRVTASAENEAFATSSDGGLTFTQPVRVAGALTAFLRLADGTVLLGAVKTNGDPVGFRSTDQGRTFTDWPGAPHLRALAERGGTLFAAADNFRDHFALGVSTDGGLTFQPLLTYDQVRRIKPCVQDFCLNICVNLAGLTLWPLEVCGEMTDGGAPASPKAGCGCDSAAGAAGAGASPMAGIAAMLAICLALIPAPRRRRPRRR